MHCGPDWLPYALKKWLSVKFNIACKFHDLDYENPKLSRFQADNMFLSAMISQSKTHRDIAYAFVFYLSVRVLGKHRWGKL